jgi:hypothetical protein
MEFREGSFLAKGLLEPFGPPSPLAPAVHTPSAPEKAAVEPPPEVAEEKVLVRIDKIDGISADAMRKLEQGLARLAFVKLAGQGYFDRMVRGAIRRAHSAYVSSTA